MIHEVDQSLGALLRRELSLAFPEIRFEAPDADWAARLSSPTVNVHLYDVREDTRRRTAAAPYVSLSYLITCWTPGIEDEHRLLSDLLRTLLRHPALPREDLAGSLAELAAPVPMVAARPPVGTPQLLLPEGPPKAGIHLVVTVPIDLRPAPGAPPPASGGLRLDAVDTQRVGAR